VEKDVGVIGITTYEQVEQNVAIAHGFEPLSEEQRAELERRATA
jgi:aryl-alcohol dehydrogenase-like predicted oxidoreductase